MKRTICFKNVISVMCVGIMLGLVGIVAKAEDSGVVLENYELKALGRLQQDVDNSGAFGDNPEDFVYDADDLHAIEDLVKTGKTNLSAAINMYPTTHVQTLDTFDNLTSAINSLTAFPTDTYYYDSTTGVDDASTLVRYIKENDSYYLCDQNGNKTSEEAQTVDENNLVEYTQMTQENLSAGTAGMVDKAFVLGNGSDNITYRNLGYADGVAQNNILVTYHQHSSACYSQCTGTNSSPQDHWQGQDGGYWLTVYHCTVNPNHGYSQYQYKDTRCTYTELSCGKNTSTIEYITVNGVVYN